MVHCLECYDVDFFKNWSKKLNPKASLICADFIVWPSLSDCGTNSREWSRNTRPFIAVYSIFLVYSHCTAVHTYANTVHVYTPSSRGRRIQALDQGLGAVSGSIKENHAKCRVKPGDQTQAQGVILHLRHEHNLIFIFVLMSDMTFPFGNAL